jgi:hypothetical protein
MQYYFISKIHSLRYALEAFFSGILLKYRDKQSLIFSVIDGSCHAEQFRKLSEEAYPKMTPINAALKNATIWDAVKIEFNLPTTLRLPNFRYQLLYGVIVIKTVAFSIQQRVRQSSRELDGLKKPNWERLSLR